MVLQQQATQQGPHQGGDDRAREAGRVEPGAQGHAGGELGRQGRVGQVDPGVEAVGHDRDQQEDREFQPQPTGRHPPHQRHGKAQGHRTADDPGQSGPPGGLGLVTQPADDRIVDGIPEAGQHQHQARHPGRHAHGRGVEDEQIKADQGSGHAGAGIAHAVGPEHASARARFPIGRIEVDLAAAAIADRGSLGGGGGQGWGAPAEVIMLQPCPMVRHRTFRFDQLRFGAPTSANSQPSGRTSVVVRA